MVSSSAAAAVLAGTAAEKASAGVADSRLLNQKVAAVCVATTATKNTYSVSMPVRVHVPKEVTWSKTRETKFRKLAAKQAVVGLDGKELETFRILERSRDLVLGQRTVEQIIRERKLRLMERDIFTRIAEYVDFLQA